MFARFAERSDGVKWTAPSLPDLSKYKWLWADSEATSKNPFTARPVGYSFYTEDGNKWYLPFGHAGGGNLDERLVKRWFEREIRDKDISWLNAKYDTHVTHNWGIDLEALGNRCHDVSYQAALLDEYRRKFNLEILCNDVLGIVGKDQELGKNDKSQIADMPAAMVGPYAEIDAQRVYQLDMAMRYGIESKLKNSIKSDDLDKVLDLEDSIIFAVVTMERNGALIDRPKLERWVREAEAAYHKLIMELYRRVGFRVNPDASTDMSRMFRYLGIDPPRTDKGQDSFEGDYLAKLPNPEIQIAVKARRIASLLSKYLKKYLKALDDKNILRYSLHQLRANNDDKGTVSGRFSSASPGEGIPGANIQQIMRTKDQIRDVGPDWLIRELFIPSPGKVWLCADAAQIEFRLFAHYANSPKLNKAYGDNPRVDFHDMVRDLIRLVIPDFDRQPAKTINFSKVYGAGRVKIALQLGILQSISDKFVDAYESEFPEAGRLLRQATKLAENRGWVKTFMGRRAKFTKPSSQDPKIRLMEEIAYKPHSALNRILQGTAADVMKKKIFIVHRERKVLNYTERFVVHDEFDGDQDPDPVNLKNMDELLNTQDFNFRIPILWEAKTGANWKEAK